MRGHLTRRGVSWNRVVEMTYQIASLPGVGDNFQRVSPGPTLQEAVQADHQVRY